MRLKKSFKNSVSFKLPFNYTELPTRPSPAFPHKKTTLLPLVEISFPMIDETSVGYSCLVDSGAEYCFFHKQIGKEILGLDIEQGPKLSDVRGVTGDTFDAYFHKVRFSLQGWEIDDAYVGFAELGANFGILGQYELFEVFKVAFNKAVDRFELDACAPLEAGGIEPYQVTEALRGSRQARAQRK